MSNLRAAVAAAGARTDGEGRVPGIDSASLVCVGRARHGDRWAVGVHLLPEVSNCCCSPGRNGGVREKVMAVCHCCCDYHLFGVWQARHQIAKVRWCYAVDGREGVVVAVVGGETTPVPVPHRYLAAAVVVVYYHRQSQAPYGGRCTGLRH
jgi:hypothetical protein